MKKDVLKANSVGIKNNNKKKKKKDKHKKNDTDSEQRNSSFEISDCENNQSVENENLDSSIEKSDIITPNEDDKNESNIEPNNDDTVAKKKRKRNKGKKVKLEANINTASELRIMSKYLLLFFQTYFCKM